MRPNDVVFADAMMNCAALLLQLQRLITLLIYDAKPLFAPLPIILLCLSGPH